MFGSTFLTTNNVMETRVSADNAPAYKPGGITIDWSTIAAVGSDTTLADSSVIRNGQKYLRYGQIMTKITSGQQVTATITGGPTGGTFTITVGGQTTTGIAYNASAATVQAALVALTSVGTGNATVTGSGGGPYTITLATSLGAQTITASGASLTGGTSPGVTISTTTANGTNYLWFGPYDPNAVDGRQNLNRGECFILDETVVQFDAGTAGISPENTQIGRVFDAGLAWFDRILQVGSGSATLAGGPTLTNFLAAFPSVRLVKN